MKTFAFSLSPQRVALSTAATLGLATLACPLQALAQSASINATQLSIDVAPISITGTRLGGSVNALGSGLTGGAPPTVTATGSLTAGTTMTAAQGATFNFDVRARAGDDAATAATAGAVPAASFGSVTGRYSAAAAGTTLGIDAGNVANVQAGTGQGTTATAVFSTTMGSTENQAQVRRVATSSNQQTTFTAERQATQFQFGGSGLAEVTAGGITTTTAVGAAATPVVGGGGTPQVGVAFTLSQGVTVGQASSALTASTTGVTQPGYGSFTNTLGGSSAGSITTPTGINAMGVGAGGAGTSSTLSVIQSLTAF